MCIRWTEKRLQNLEQAKQRLQFLSKRSLREYLNPKLWGTLQTPLEHDFKQHRCFTFLHRCSTKKFKTLKA